jgi:hypothetical protein
VAAIHFNDVTKTYGGDVPPAGDAREPSLSRGGSVTGGSGVSALTSRYPNMRNDWGQA